jgi:hypothetical protein
MGVGGTWYALDPKKECNNPRFTTTIGTSRIHELSFFLFFNFIKSTIPSSTTKPNISAITAFPLLEHIPMAYTVRPGISCGCTLLPSVEPKPQSREDCLPLGVCDCCSLTRQCECAKLLILCPNYFRGEEAAVIDTMPISRSC